MWNDWLVKNDLKIVYSLCDANAPDLPKYIGETRRPLMRLNQHMQEAVIYGYPSNKSQWIRQCSSDGVQIILRPLLVIPKHKRLIYEKTIRCLMTELGSTIFNPAKTSAGVYKLLETVPIAKNHLSPFLMELMLQSGSTAKIYNKMIDGIQ